MQLSLTHYWFDAGRRGVPTVKTADKDEQASRQEQPIRCRQCNAVITAISERCLIADRHVHRCRNPAGINFEFGCFRQAGGCAAIGPATDEYTWFPGCRWQIAVCRQCKTHLGWYFSGADAFYGLILVRLQEAD